MPVWDLFGVGGNWKGFFFEGRRATRGSCLLFPPWGKLTAETTTCPVCRMLTQLRVLSGKALPWHLASACHTQLSPPRRGLSSSSGIGVLLDLRAGSPGQLSGPREAGAHGAPADYFIPGQRFFLLPNFCCYVAALEFKLASVSFKGQGCLAVFRQYFLEASRFSTRTSS